MFLSVPALAQKKQHYLLKWDVAAELPADSGQQTALGVAGPVTGIHKDKLFVGGGANFPVAMPWQGGGKKYHAAVHVYSAKHGKLKLLAKSFSLRRAGLSCHRQTPTPPVCSTGPPIRRANAKYWGD